MVPDENNIIHINAQSARETCRMFRQLQPPGTSGRGADDEEL
jgi:hypothetical protein